MKAKRRILSLLLCAAMLFSTVPQTAAAEEVQDSGTAVTADGLCEHHPQHTAECGYIEVSEGTSCTHEHTEGCYTLVSNCVHEHTAECYPADSVSDNTATPSEADEAEPTECTHVCSEESGCVTRELNCQHQHDENCGYSEGTAGTPCGYVCEICDPQDSGEPEAAGTEVGCVCTTLCTEGSVNGDCPVCGAEGADLTACQGEAQPASPSNAIDEAVQNVQDLINALSDMESMGDDEREAAIVQYTEAYEAYDALTNEQKAQITGAEVLEEFLVLMNSGEPLADLPGTEINLSTLTSTYTISDSNTYSFTGSGSYGINVTSDNPTIVLSNATINVSSGPAINITGGSPTIKVEGSSTVQCSGSSKTTQGAGIYVAQGSSVTITADNRSSTLIARAGSDGAGIGSYGRSTNITTDTTLSCGDITITNVTVYAYSSASLDIHPGIGARTTSGIITIDNATVYAYGTGSIITSSPAIGSRQTLPIINILHDSTVYAYRGACDGTSYADYIGLGGSMDGYQGGQIQTGTGGSITNSTIYIGNYNYGYGGYAPTETTTFPITMVSVSVAIGGSPVTNATLGSTVSITANISQASSNALTRAAANQVEFFVGTGNNRQSLGTVAVSNNTATLPNVSITTENGWTLGTNTITAEYGGGSGLLGNSGTTTLTVNAIPLDAPAEIAWSTTTPGQATWSAVTNASGYELQLYKDGSAQGSPVTASGTSHDFQITEAGSYTFKVKAKGNGTTYTDSPEAESAVLNYYTVSFDTDGGGTIDSQVVVSGGKVSKPNAPTKEGHTFDGWYSDSSFAEGSEWTFTTSTVTAATTLYAKWTAIAYDIAITVQGGTGTASASVNSTTATSANMGDTVTLTAAPAEGYHFVRWEVTPGGVTINNNSFTMPAGAVAITAVFAEHTFTGWTANGNDTHTGTCSCGETSTVDCTYANGVCTVCGYVDVTATDPASSSVKEGETATFTVTATGNDISYQWQISTDGGSTWADIEGATSQSYTIQTAAMDMSGDQYRCVVSNATGDSDTSSAATLTVNKTPSTIDPAFIGYFVEHYQKDPASGKYSLFEREYFVGAINTQVTATPKTYTGYAYNAAAAGTVTSGTLTKIQDEADIVTLKLYYDPESYSVTLNANGGTITSGDVTEYTYGIGAALPTAKDMTYNGYVFKGWYARRDFSGEAVTAISATDTGEKTYYAKWTRLYTVTVTAGNGGTVSGGGTFEDGSTVTVKATASNRYRFVRWVDENGTEVSTSASYTFTLTADRSLTAVFKRRNTGGGGWTQQTTNPPTGDASHMELWTALMLLSGAGLCTTSTVISATRRRRKRQRN